MRSLTVRCAAAGAFTWICHLFHRAKRSREISQRCKQKDKAMEKKIMEKKIQKLVDKSDNMGTTIPVLWYFSHLYGRSEIVRMALTMAGIRFEFAGFNNAEWKLLKPHLISKKHLEWGLPFLQIDGMNLSQTKSIVRYVGMKGGLYPVNNIKLSYQVESIMEGADDLFTMLITYHYKKYNKKGGNKAPSDDTDRRTYGAKVSASVLGTYRKFTRILSTNICSGSQYLVGDRLTIADILVCQYRWVLEQPEFAPLAMPHFEGQELVVFESYYSKMKELHFEKYFNTRYGSAADVTTKSIAEHENVSFPFEW